MHHIVIAIPTYKRPQMLGTLLSGIFQQIPDTTLISEVRVIVVDNDKEKTAANTVQQLLRELPGGWMLDYISYTEKGLSNVRNEMLRKSYELNPDYIVFIDDDEYVTAGWLNALVSTITDTGADASRGPVKVNIAPEVPDEITCWFSRENYPDRSLLKTISSGNLILRTSSLQSFNVWFDLRFNKSGGEDSYFGMQLLQKGAVFSWAANAVAYETIPPERATLRWLKERSRAGASTYTYLLRTEKQYLSLYKKMLVSVVYIFFGTLTLPMVILPLRKRYWGLLKLYEGVGAFLGLTGKLTESY